MKSRTKRMKKAQNAKLNAPKPQVWRTMNKLNMQADSRKKASPRANCLQNDYLATNDRVRIVRLPKNGADAESAHPAGQHKQKET
jgi:hypothetical protein